ncbi:MAG: shikimate dehydrogenase [Anaerolineae bacterium]|nr:shikimate dehydrogenase [Anaerolineae bacterium]
MTISLPLEASRALTITSRTRVVGVMGWPVAHSLSPAMHNAAFQALGLDWAYIPLPVPPERLAAAVAGAQALGLAGANVTIPHKQAVMDLVDEMTPAARAIGAVNTLRFNGRIFGDNTDWTGFLNALGDVGYDPTGQRAVILGAGGAARSIVYALASVNASVAVYNRTLDRAEEIVTGLRAVFPGGRLEAYTLDVLPQELDRTPQLIVNTTSLGMAPRIEGTPWPAGLPIPPYATVYDLVYNPLATRFLKSAKAAGARAVDGLGMLVHQGARAFTLWTGVEPPTEVMYKACLQYL